MIKPAKGFEIVVSLYITNVAKERKLIDGIGIRDSDMMIVHFINPTKTIVNGDVRDCDIVYIVAKENIIATEGKYEEPVKEVKAEVKEE